MGIYRLTYTRWKGGKWHTRTEQVRVQDEMAARAFLYQCVPPEEYPGVIDVQPVVPAEEVAIG